jgi:putative membrane protein
MRRTDVSSVDGFAAVVRRLFRLLRTISLAAIAFAAYVFVRETYVLAKASFDLHPIVGGLFVAAVVVATWRFVVRPARRYWAVPEALTPPELDQGLEAASLADLATRARFLDRTLENLAANPRVGAGLGRIGAARDEARAIAAAAKADGASPDDLRRRLAAFEAKEVEPLYAPLDEEANRAVRAEALAVGFGTAVSMNGVLDAWIVLWRNLNLAAKVAEIYYGRPGVRGTLMILRDVAIGVFAASKAQGLADGAAGVFGGWLGKTGSVLMGPVVDGAINAAVTVRIGYVAKRRCRSFRKWTNETAVDYVRRGLAEAASHAKGAALDVVKAAGGGVAHAAADAASAAGDAVRKARDYVLGWFVEEETTVVVSKPGA